MKYNKLNILIAGFIFLFIVIGCGKSKPTEPVAIKDFCKAENKGSGAMIEGYVWTNESVQCKKSATFMTRCMLEMYDDPEHQGDSVMVTFKQGNGSGEMEKLPSPFNQRDILIRTDKGEEIGVKDKIRITGYAYLKGKGGKKYFEGCYINAMKIEKAK